MSEPNPPYVISLIASIAGSGVTCFVAWRVFKASTTGFALRWVLGAYVVLALSALLSVFASAGMPGVAIALPFLAVAALAVVVCVRFGVKPDGGAATRP